MENIQNANQLASAIRSIAGELLEERDKEFTLQVGDEEITVNRGLDHRTGYANSDYLDVCLNVRDSIMAVFETNDLWDLFDLIKSNPVVEIIERHTW